MNDLLNASFHWWHKLTDVQRIEYIGKETPNYINYTSLMKYALHRKYDKDPQYLFTKYVINNQNT
jgi:hypothetical protein